LKHSIPKGDKKKKKEVTAEIAKLEAELEQKHEDEMKQFNEVKSDTLVSLVCLTSSVKHVIKVC
jgi:OTU domain-containing protein 6